METKLHLVTSRYGNKDLAASGLVCIGITAFSPRFRLTYTLRANLRILAPTPAMLAQARSGRLTPKQFEAKYSRLLDRVGAERIVSTLCQFQGDAKGLVLLCYEDVTQGEVCHRRMLAQWLKRKVGIEVPEFTTAARAAAIGYIRRSHESTERTVSLVNQRSSIEQYAQAQGWHLVDVVEHDGVSGGKRSRFAAIDAALKQHRAKVLIVYSMDRAGRDVVGLLSWLERAQRAGIQLHVCGKGQVETRTSSGFLTVSIEAAVAEHHRRITGEKTAAALHHLRSERRKWTRVPPYGWAWKDGQCVPDPTEQAVVARARMLRDTGLSLRAIAATLAAEGMTSRQGTVLSAETIRSFLRAFTS